MTKRTALVIGVGAEIGLGAALCRRFASAGSHVLVAGRTPGKLEKVATSIVAAGGSAEAVTMRRFSTWTSRSRRWTPS